MHNDLKLSASVEKEEELRYTPAGLPVLQIWLTHQSRKQQATIMRDVSCEIQAILIGDKATLYTGKLLGKQVNVSGFIAKRSLRNPRLVLHIESIELNKD